MTDEAVTTPYPGSRRVLGMLWLWLFTCLACPAIAFGAVLGAAWMPVAAGIAQQVWWDQNVWPYAQFVAWSAAAVMLGAGLAYAIWDTIGGR